jgi:hypothetical protein
LLRDFPDNEEQGHEPEKNCDKEPETTRLAAFATLQSIKERTP